MRLEIDDGNDPGGRAGLTLGTSGKTWDTHITYEKAKMTDAPLDDLRNRLLTVINGIAMYNDKGYLWSGHDADEVRRHQGEAQRAIMELVSEIGEQNFSRDLLGKLKSGEAAMDGNGDISLLARNELLGNR